MTIVSEAEPVVLVGMPRSGSTMLTRIVNESHKHYVLNDFYGLQMIDAMDAWTHFASREAQLTFLKYLTMMIAHRSGLDAPPRIDDSSHLTRPQLDGILRRIAPSNVEFGNWAFTMTFVMKQVDGETGKTCWGWNTPQDHHHIDRIMNAFPKAKVLFLVRDPAAILLSYKNYPDKMASTRYHPIAQSFAWRQSIRNFCYAKSKYGSAVGIMRYEDILKNANVAVDTINKFLDAEIPNDLDLRKIGSNTSFNSSDRNFIKKITPIEFWISDRLLYVERQIVGYKQERAPFSIIDICGLLLCTIKFVKFYSSAFLESRDVRKRVYRLLGSP